METTSQRRPLNENFYEQNRKHRRSSMTHNNKNTSVRRRALSIKSTSDLRSQTPQLSPDKLMRTYDHTKPAPNLSSNNSNDEIETFEGGARETNGSL